MIKEHIIEVLLVEDNERDADLTLRSLEKYKISNHIKWVKDGEEALDYLFGENQYEGRDINKQPNVVLLDLKMPKLNGIEVLEKIRANEKTQKLPVVMVTSSQEEKDIVRSYDLGVNSYIVKPVDFNKFTESIRDIGYYWLVMNKKPN